MKHQSHHARPRLPHKLLLPPSFPGLVFDGVGCTCGSAASMSPSPGATGLSRMLAQARAAGARYVGGTDYTPRWPVGPTIRPKCPALWGLPGPGRLELGEKPAPRLAASSCPARVIRTCQWETVLTHQIIAGRKLLQGGDILPSQYGDVKCAFGGGWEQGGV